MPKLQEKACQGTVQYLPLSPPGHPPDRGTFDSHVEQCDERGPPCANCVARESGGTCRYPNNSVASKRATSCSSSSETALEPPAASVPASQRLLELELMHRWSTTTYKSIYTLPEDQPCIQLELPRWALRHEFLLDGIFAMSALEAAICGGPEMDGAEPAMYVRAAIEYYDKGSKAFRAQLLNVSPENIHSVYMFSYMAMAINMALSQCVPDGDGNQSMLGRITMLLELFLGSSSIAVRHRALLLDSPISPLIIRSRLLLMPAIMQPIDGATNVALARLSSVVNGGVPIPHGNQAAKDAASSRLKSYQNATTNLRVCFSVGINSQMIGFCVSFPSRAGRDFTLGVKNLEPVALFILLHWAILLQKLGDWMWWAGSVGRRLVQEIADVLANSYPDLARTPEWRDGISWACKQVGIQYWIK